MKFNSWRSESSCHGDPALVQNRVTERVDDAVEASKDTSEPVIVTWGSDRDYWIVILDRGGLLPPSVNLLFEFGTSTKGHLGSGLALVRQAALALGELLPWNKEPEGSTRFSMQWPRPGRSRE